jgi:membrane fusion protein, copper/silver efflux system
MKTFLRIVLLLFVVLAAFLGGYGYRRWYAKDAAPGGTQTNERRILYWVDPMHPSYTSDKPGIAPDCGMKLVPVFEGSEGDPDIGAGPKAERRILYYVDPMNPKYRSDKPGKAPDGMDLVPVFDEQDNGRSPSDDTASLPMGTIRVDPEKQQLIGVQYGTVEASTGVRELRATGKVTFDERRIARVHTKLDGWIEKVFVDFTGQLIERGQPLMTFYSPEMLATQQEFLLALKGKELLKGSTLKGVPEQNDALVSAARRRLELWDLSETQIDDIARTQQPVKSITVRSPIDGYVVTRNAFSSQKITSETELYVIADLSKVWIMADVFENEASMVRVGAPALIRMPTASGKGITARVEFIQPQVDPATRTLKVRLEADNPGLILKPEMFVDVDFRFGMPPQITVPAEAVLDSGLRKTVFVDRGNGFLEPREVEVGQRLGERVEIRKGLQVGERIVVSGNFLIDSESQLKSAAAGMTGHAHANSSSDAPQPTQVPEAIGQGKHGTAPSNAQPGDPPRRAQ